MKTIEVYKTNVNQISTAKLILDEIRRSHPNCDSSFDLEDCNNVLRVEDSSGVNSSRIEEILQNYGFWADTLL